MVSTLEPDPTSTLPIQANPIASLLSVSTLIPIMKWETEFKPLLSNPNLCRYTLAYLFAVSNVHAAGMEGATISLKLMIRFIIDPLLW
jgi:hypothetical protein